MGENSNIEWTDHTFNGWIGCAKVSPGCANCYAETLMDTRWKKVQWGKGKPRQRTSAANWKQPIKLNREAGQRFKYVMDADKFLPRPRVFCSSLSDWLDDEVPIEWLADLLALMHATPNLDWLLLSKRPENWRGRIESAFAHMLKAKRGEVKDHEGVVINPYWEELLESIIKWPAGNPPSNVWIGTTVENQEMADKRIPLLLQIPAKVRFLSCEPLLEPVDLRNVVDWWNCEEKIHWVIVGGESGPNARQFHSAWARSLRDQCESAGVTFFMKQMGGTRKPFAPIPDDLNIRQFPTPFTPASAV